MNSEPMTVKEIRLHNARLLQDTLPGGQDEMCTLLKKGQSQVSSFMGKNPKKNIGDKIAKQIEEAFNKPKGWLDTYHRSAKEIASGGGTLITLEQTVREAEGKYTDELNKLVAMATPRSRNALEKIAEAAAKGNLTDDDLALLNQIAERFASKE